MKRSMLIVAAVLSCYSSGSQAVRADEGATYNLACGRRYVPSPRYTYVAPRPNINITRTDINVYSRYATPVTKVAPFFSRTPGPQLQLPPNGPDLTAGRTYTFKANYLGEQTGDVAIFIGSTSHGCMVKHWAPNEVVVEVPNMGVNAAGAIAELRVTRPDGVVAMSRIVRLVNPPDIIEHEELPPPGATASQFGLYPYAGPVLNPAAGG